VSDPVAMLCPFLLYKVNVSTETAASSQSYISSPDVELNPR